jgi:hypothetical protein
MMFLMAKCCVLLKVRTESLRTVLFTQVSASDYQETLLLILTTFRLNFEIDVTQKLGKGSVSQPGSTSCA